MLPERWPSIPAAESLAMPRLTFTPSSLERYATNGVQRSVTPDAFSAGTTARVSSGYLVFHCCAEAAVAVNASAAAPARISRRLIMMSPLLLVARRPIAGLQQAALTDAVLRPRRLRREPKFVNRRTRGRARCPSLRPPPDRRVHGRCDPSVRRACRRTPPCRTPCRSDDRNRSAPDRANAGCTLR